MDINPINGLGAIKPVANGVKSSSQSYAPKAEDQFNISSKARETKELVSNLKAKLASEPENTSKIEEGKQLLANGITAEVAEKAANSMLQSNGV